MGRFAVRFILRSMSRSMIMLNTPADPADMYPASDTTISSQVPGHPRAAMIIAVTVVHSSRLMTLGLVSAR